MGGTVEWLGAESKATIRLKETIIEMWIDKTTMRVNGMQKEMDIAPKLIRGRTMLPIRFIAENLGAGVQWNGKTQKAFIHYVP